MANRPTSAELTELIRELKLFIPQPLYHHVWRLIYEIEYQNGVIAHSKSQFELILAEESRKQPRTIEVAKETIEYLKEVEAH